MKRCTGKVGFITHQLAVAAARNARRNGRKVTPYHCPECRKFHTGTNDSRNRRPIKTIGVEE